jgi:hypothetical protein
VGPSEDSVRITPSLGLFIADRFMLFSFLLPLSTYGMVALLSLTCKMMLQDLELTQILNNLSVLSESPDFGRFLHGFDIHVDASPVSMILRQTFVTYPYILP